MSDNRPTREECEDILSYPDEISNIHLKRLARAYLDSLDENANLKRDKERLDWLESRAFTAYANRDPEHNTLYEPVVVDEDAKGTRRGHVRKTVREALDAAMESTASEGAPKT